MQDAHTPPDRIGQLGGKSRTGAVAADHVILDEDETSGRTERRIKRAEHGGALGKELDPIMPVGHRQRFGTKTPEQAYHPQESVFLLDPVFLAHGHLNVKLSAHRAGLSRQGMSKKTTD